MQEKTQQVSTNITLDSKTLEGFLKGQEWDKNVRYQEAQSTFYFFCPMWFTQEEERKGISIGKKKRDYPWMTWSCMQNIQKNPQIN